MIILKYLAGFYYFLSKSCMFLIDRRGYPFELISEYGVMIDHLFYNVQMVIIFGALGYNIGLSIGFIIKRFGS